MKQDFATDVKKMLKQKIFIKEEAEKIAHHIVRHVQMIKQLKELEN